jgi:hypothetical protein
VVNFKRKYDKNTTWISMKKSRLFDLNEMVSFKRKKWSILLDNQQNKSGQVTADVFASGYKAEKEK